MMVCGEFLCCTTEGGKFCRRWYFGIGCGIGNVKVQWNNINKFLLGTLIKLVVKVERRPRYTWLTQNITRKRW